MPLRTSSSPRSCWASSAAFPPSTPTSRRAPGCRCTDGAALQRVERFYRDNAAAIHRCRGNDPGLRHPSAHLTHVQPRQGHRHDLLYRGQRLPLIARRLKSAARQGRRRTAALGVGEGCPEATSDIAPAPSAERVHEALFLPSPAICLTDRPLHCWPPVGNHSWTRAGGSRWPPTRGGPTQVAVAPEDGCSVMAVRVSARKLGSLRAGLVSGPSVRRSPTGDGFAPRFVSNERSVPTIAASSGCRTARCVGRSRISVCRPARGASRGRSRHSCAGSGRRPAGRALSVASRV